MSNDVLDRPLGEGQVEKLALDEPARALVPAGMTVRQALTALVQGGQWIAAWRLMAWSLPRREAVWWACQCVRSTWSDREPPGEETALLAAERWVATPTEENRRSAQSAAQAVEYGTPAGCVAMAAFWSSGSLAPPKLTAVPPPEHLLPGMVANAVILASVRREPEKALEKYERFLALAYEVAAGKNRWKEEGRPPQRTPSTAEKRR